MGVCKMAANVYHKLQVLIIIIFVLATASFAAPELSYEELTTISDDEIVITWVTSNETSNSGIQYGIAGATTTYTTDEGSSRANYHYLKLDGLYPNTFYAYRIFSTNAAGETTYGEYGLFQTLNPPSGEYLFSFTTMSDLQTSQDLANTVGARGRPYATSEAMLEAAISEVILHDPSFTVIKGDLIDDRSTETAADAAGVIGKVNTLKADHTVFPIPGNHDKASWADKDPGWHTELLRSIFNPTTFAPPAGFSNYNYDTDISDEAEEDSIYNYSFDFGNYHFIMLDTLRERDVNSQCVGHVDTTWLINDLTTNSTKKSFIFMHNVTTLETRTIPDEVIREVIGIEAADPINMNLVDLDNRASFLNILGTHEANIAGVFMGHIHDNSRYYINDLDFPFVRT
ncbi:MAG: metallophosphoesterase family protein, partial [bacterium]